MIKKIVKYIFALVFLISAFTKLHDYQGTVELFSNILGFQITLTKILLSILILIELFIFYLIINDFLKKRFVVNSIFVLLIFFTLISVFFVFKNYENCGCFGNSLVSTPIQSLIKNLVLIIILSYLKKAYQNNASDFIFNQSKIK